MPTDKPAPERPPRKWPRRVLIALALVVAVVVALVLLPPAPPQALPNPNGYNDFLKASAAIVGDPSTNNTLNHDALAALVATNAEALGLLRLGLSRQCAVLPYPGMNWQADLAALKRTLFLLEAEGRLAEMEGRTNDAVNICLEMMRYGNELSRGGPIIFRLVGIACESVGYSNLVRLAPALDCAQSKPVIASLKKLDDDGVTWAGVMRAEHAFARRQMRQTSFLTWLPQWWTTRALNKKAENRHYRMLAKVRLLEVELALRCYRAEHGTAPARIEDLVPGQLASVPLDPFSGEILTYKPRGTNWLLYSFDVDRVDNGGEPTGRSTPGGPPPQGDLLYDSP